ncbi:MAG: DUF11 domain-containing protein [Actinomycetota bacterium]|nr:DUF11 domain-containing protein [Actinomycetota bacterium]
MSSPERGTYSNVGTVTGTLPDPNPANNSSSAALALTAPMTVTAPPVQNAAPMCYTVSLAGVRLKAAKGIVGRALGCTVGKLTTKKLQVRPAGRPDLDQPGSEWRRRTS